MADRAHKQAWRKMLFGIRAFHPIICVRIWFEFVEPNDEMRTTPEAISTKRSKRDQR
jgi:hypothetical protein